MHLGHAAIAYLNSEIATRSGGEFTLRFDDNQIYWRDLLGKDSIRKNCTAMVEELDLLGIYPDNIRFHSDYHDYIQAFLAKYSDIEKCDHKDGLYEMPEMANSATPQYPYASYLTAEVVYLDYLDHVDRVVIGEELCGRFSLYMDYWRRFSFGRYPKVTHVPRLQCKASGELSSVSKTSGNYRIRDIYDKTGFTPQEFKRHLATMYLKKPDEPWDIGNIQREPCIA